MPPSTDNVELSVRRYMDDLYDRALPKIVGAAIASHNDDIGAHDKKFEQHQVSCPSSKKIDRLVTLLIGAAFGAGLGSGVGLARFFSF
jgi:hypothetical protein